MKKTKAAARYFLLHAWRMLVVLALLAACGGPAVSESARPLRSEKVELFLAPNPGGQKNAPGFATARPTFERPQADLKEKAPLPEAATAQPAGARGTGLHKPDAHVATRRGRS